MGTERLDRMETMIGDLTASLKAASGSRRPRSAPPATSRVADKSSRFLAGLRGSASLFPGMEGNVSSEESDPSLSESATRKTQVPSAPMDPNSLIQLEILKMLQKKKKSSSDSDTSSSGRSSHGAGGLRKVHRLRRNIRKHPTRIV